MTAKLGHNTYGKTRVRVVKVQRHGATHELRELNVDVRLEGDFETAHTKADNSRVVPTDTMKNTVNVFTKQPIKSIEDFAERLANHFVNSFDQVDSCLVEVAEVKWTRAKVGGEPHPHTFLKGSDERQTCSVRVGEGAARSSGLRDLAILKTTDSAFSNFNVDKYTTLKDASDRIMGTRVESTWEFAEDDVDYASVRERIRTAVIETFADHKSESVQHTLFDMGAAALEACPEISRIHFAMPNVHCLVIDLSPFGLENNNEVFLPIDEPSGYIEAWVERD